MTKVSVFVKQPTEQPKELKKIEFVSQLTVNGTIADFNSPSNSYENIQLLFKKGFGKYDVMLVWNNNSWPYVVLGHWNDGVV